MHILMVLDHPFPPDIRVENEAASLVEAGFEVTVLALAPDDRPREAWHKGFRIVRDRVPEQIRNKMRGLAGTIPALTWYVSHRLRRLHHTLPFDAIHVHDLYLFGGGLRAGRKLGVPVVGDLHENWVEALRHYAWSSRAPGKWVVSIPRWERLERKWVNAVDRLVVVIEEAAERNLSLGVPRERITVVPNTIKTDVFEAFGTDEALVEDLRSAWTITYTGGFDVHRGLASVIEAMPEVFAAVPEARLVLVGEGRIRPELEALAERLGVAGRVRFEGWQPQARLKSYILGSAVCLVPHLRTPHTDATIPHKLFHYMYFGRPVVVSDCRPLARIVRETEAGLVYPAGDPKALGEALVTLAGDRARAEEMGAHGREAVLKRYNWDVTVRGLIEMYRTLSTGRNR